MLFSINHSSIPIRSNTESCFPALTTVDSCDLDDGESNVSWTTGSLNETDRALIGIVVVSLREERAVVVVSDFASTPIPLKSKYIQEVV